MDVEVGVDVDVGGGGEMGVVIHQGVVDEPPGGL